MKEYSKLSQQRVGDGHLSNREPCDRELAKTEHTNSILRNRNHPVRELSDSNESLRGHWPPTRGVFERYMQERQAEDGRFGFVLESPSIPFVSRRIRRSTFRTKSRLLPKYYECIHGTVSSWLSRAEHRDVLRGKLIVIRDLLDRGTDAVSALGRWSTMNRRILAIMTLAAAFSTVPPVFAHHGLARFDTTHIVTMKGTITRFDWINPHSYVYADITENGKTANWMLECGSLGMLSRFGWSPDVVKRGDKVTVYGFIAKDGSPYMALQKIDLPNGKSLPGEP